MKRPNSADGRWITELWRSGSTRPGNTKQLNQTRVRSDRSKSAVCTSLIVCFEICGDALLSLHIFRGMSGVT